MIGQAVRRPIPPLTGIVAAVLVALGVLLWMFVSRGMLIVAGIGAFGPGILREIGWPKDHDEFQRQAARRAGYHAYLVGGLAAMILLSVIEWGGEAIDQSAEWVRFVVVVLWLTWLASTLIMYWGAPKTVSLVLMAFGSFWLVFVAAELASGVIARESWQNMLLGTSVGIGVVGPFFGLAWSAHRFRRVTGTLLLAIAMVFMIVFVRPGRLAWSTMIMTQAMLSGPLVVCGSALLLNWGGEIDGDEEPEPAVQVAEGVRGTGPPGDGEWRAVRVARPGIGGSDEPGDRRVDLNPWPGRTQVALDGYDHTILHTHPHEDRITSWAPRNG